MRGNLWLKKSSHGKKRKLRLIISPAMCYMLSLMYGWNTISIVSLPSYLLRKFQNGASILWYKIVLMMIVQDVWLICMGSSQPGFLSGQTIGHHIGQNPVVFTKLIRKRVEGCQIICGNNRWAVVTCFIEWWNKPDVSQLRNLLLLLSAPVLWGNCMSFGCGGRYLSGGLVAWNIQIKY